MSILSNAIGAMLVPGLQAVMGLAATYARGDTQLSITVIAQDGGRERENATRLGDSPDGTDYAIFTPELGYAGFSVKVGDLATLTPPVPQRGDVITIGSDSYQLLAPAGLNPWRWEDLPFKQLFRCHTKKV
jgi:hypothetical protein